MNPFKRIHPHGRLWFITMVVLIGVLLINPRVQYVVHPPQSEVVAYYQNEYQHYAIIQLAKQNKLEQYPCLYEMWTRESHWNPKARNTDGGALGIAQLKPLTWKLIGTQPTYNGFKQVDAGLKYIDRHYGTTGGICKAYAHHLAKGWY